MINKLCRYKLPIRVSRRYPKHGKWSDAMYLMSIVHHNPSRCTYACIVSLECNCILPHNTLLAHATTLTLGHNYSCSGTH